MLVIAVPKGENKKLMKFADLVGKVFTSDVKSDHWKLLACESPDAEEEEKSRKKQKFRENSDVEEIDEGEHEKIDEESSEDDEQPEFELDDLSVRYWCNLFMHLGVLKTTVCFFFLI